MSDFTPEATATPNAQTTGSEMIAPPQSLGQANTIRTTVDVIMGPQSMTEPVIQLVAQPEAAPVSIQAPVVRQQEVPPGSPEIPQPVEAAKPSVLVRKRFVRAPKIPVKAFVLKLIKRPRKERPVYVRPVQVTTKSSRALLASMLFHVALAVLIMVFVPPVMVMVKKVVDDSPQVVVEMKVEEPEIEVAAGKQEPQTEKAEAAPAPQEPQLKEPPPLEEEVAKIDEVDLTLPVDPTLVQEMIAVATDHGPLIPSDSWRAVARRTAKPAPAKVVSNAYVAPNGTGSGAGNAPVTVTANQGFGVPGGKSNGARLVGTIDPKYPAEMKNAKKSATVKLRLYLDAKGKIQNVEVLSTGIEAAFLKAADAAVRKAKFDPAQTNGVAVESTIRVSVEFRLE